MGIFGILVCIFLIALTRHNTQIADGTKAFWIVVGIICALLGLLLG